MVMKGVEAPERVFKLLAAFDAVPCGVPTVAAFNDYAEQANGGRFALAAGRCAVRLDNRARPY
jgi:hypothetical protein